MLYKMGRWPQSPRTCFYELNLNRGISTSPGHRSTTKMFPVNCFTPIMAPIQQSERVKFWSTSFERQNIVHKQNIEQCNLIGMLDT